MTFEPLCKILSFPTIMVHVFAIATFELAETKDDRALFNQEKIGLPLFEGKSIHQFNASHGQFQYWVDENKGRERLKNTRYLNWYQNCRIAFREIARSTDSRTCIAAILPPNSFATITLWTATTFSNPTDLYFVSILNSLCFDYLTRFRVGTHMTLFLTKQLPVPRLTAGDPYFDAIVPRAAQLSCTTAAFAPLWQEVMGTPWSDPGATHLQSASHLAPTTDPAQRQQLRNELDALVAHLYGLNRDEFAHILHTFPLVFPNTPEGEAKKETLLAVYDDIKSVMRDA